MEIELLSAIKQYPAIIDEIEVDQNAFFDPENRSFFITCRDMYLTGQEINDVTLHSAGVTGKQIVKYCLPTMSNWKYYHDELKNRYMRKQVEKITATARDRILHNKPVDEVISYLEKAITGLNVENENVKEIKDFISDVVLEIEEAHKNKKTNNIKTGYFSLDRIIQMRGGELTIIASRPSIGKTTLATNIINNIIKNKINCGFFSAEMKDSVIIKRMLSAMSGVPMYRIFQGFINNGDMEKIVDAASLLYENHLLIDDTPNIKINKLISKARYMKRKGAKIIMIDYLTLIKHPDKKMPRYERVGEISKMLKELARETDLPVIALSQLRRESEDKKPLLADLRQSGEIEEDADIVLLMHRKNRQDENLEVIVAKQRNGPCGSCSMKIDLNTNKIYEE